MPHPSEIATGSYQGGKSASFTFDAAGRETRMEVTGEGDARTVETSYYPSSQVAERTRWVAGNAAVEEAFAYRSDGLIAEMMRSGGANNSKDQTYAYDLNGNRTSDERGSHSFNARDQLVLWERGENQPKPGTFVSYVVNGSREQRPDGGSADYDYSASGERMGQRMRDSSSDEFHPYAKDANGSVEALEQDDGSIAEADRYRYDPYGELEDPNEDNDQDADSELGTDAESNPFRFQGFYYDAAIKTYDMQAREYRPEVGRFLSADRFEAAGMDLALQSDPLTQNRYAFAGGNPVSNIEWDGHRACSGWECGYHDHGGPWGWWRRWIARRRW